MFTLSEDKQAITVQINEQMSVKGLEALIADLSRMREHMLPDACALESEHGGGPDFLRASQQDDDAHGGMAHQNAGRNTPHSRESFLHEGVSRMKRYWKYDTRVGTVRLRAVQGCWHAIIGDVSLGAYQSPIDAHFNLVGGHIFTPLSGLDTSTLRLAADLADWQFVRVE